MKEIIYKELSYKIVGLLFRTHKDLGRFRNEKQYGDYFEKLLVENHINFVREFRFIDIKNNENVSRCILDFLIEDKIIIEFKAKSYISKEDYFQVQRYLSTLNKRLGIIVNFRQITLYPKRVAN